MRVNLQRAAKRVGRARIWPTAGVFLIVLSSLFVACSAPPSSGANATQQGDPLLEKYASLVAQAAPATDAVVAELSKEVIAAGLARDDTSAIQYIIDHYRNENLGIVAEQAYLDRLLQQGEDQAISYCREILKKHGGTPTAACALEFLLRQLKTGPPESYLQTCQQAIQGKEPRLACTALLSRMDFYKAADKPKLAALDALQLWRYCPEKVDSAQLKPVLAGCLESAGYLLESDIMQAASRPAEDAATILQWIEANGVPDALEQEQGSNAIQRLFLMVPDTDQLLQEVRNAIENEAKAAILLHCIRLELDKTTDQQVVPLLSHYFEITDGLLHAKNPYFPVLRLLNQATARAVSKYVGFHKNDKHLATDPRAATKIRKLAKAVERLADIQVAFCENCTAEADSDECNAQSLNLFLTEIDAPHANEKMLQAFISSHPTTSDVSELKFKLAELQRDKLNQPQKAAETFLHLFKDDPTLPKAQQAGLLGCILLFKQESNEQALPHLQELQLVMDKTDVNYPLVLFLVALCEHRLGLRQDAESHLIALVRDHAQSKVCAQGLLFLGYMWVSEQRYGEALSAFQDLIARYPDASVAEEARGFVKRLSKLPDVAP